MVYVNVTNEWAMHTLSHWQAVAENPEAPGPLRVAAYAYARVTGNRHVSAVDLTTTLEMVNRKTGELSTPSLASVKRWRRDAVRIGLLHPDTWGRCLVLPDEITTRLTVKGSRFSRCLVCENRTRQQGVRVQDLHPSTP